MISGKILLKCLHRPRHLTERHDKKLDNCTSLSLYILFVGFQQDMAGGGIIVEDLI